MQKGQVIKATDFLRAIDDKIIGKVDTTLTLTAGTGLSGGGNLTANRTFNFDTTWGDNRYTVSSRTISTGDGLSGGGNLTANRTLTVDSTVVRTSRNLTAGTGISGGGNLSADRTFSFDTTWGDARYSLSGHNHDSVYALRTLTLTAGTGITGGGNLTTNRTFDFDTTWGDGRYVIHGRSVSAGNGLTGGGDLSANRTVTLGTPSTLNGTTTNAVTSDSHTHNIDATDSRTNSSTATLLNAKAMNDHRTSGDHDGRYFVKHQGLITDFNTALTEGGYLVNGTASNAPHTGQIWGKLVVYVSDGGTHNNSNNWIWQFFESTNNTSWSRFKVNAGAWSAWRQHWNSHSFDPSSKADTTVTVSAGTGLSGGGTIAANRTLSFDTTWGDNRYTLSSRTITAGDGLSGGGNLTANRTLAVDSTVVRTSRTLTAGTGITGGGDLSANRSFAFDTTWGDARYASSGVTITAGNGLSGGGNLGANRTITLGTPGTISNGTSNSVTATSHTHAINVASETEAESGTDHVNLMTPLRTKNAIDKFALTLSGGTMTGSILFTSGTSRNTAISSSVASNRQILILSGDIGGTSRGAEIGIYGNDDSVNGGHTLFWNGGSVSGRFTSNGDLQLNNEIFVGDRLRIRSSDNEFANIQVGTVNDSNAQLRITRRGFVSGASAYMESFGVWADLSTFMNDTQTNGYMALGNSCSDFGDQERPTIYSSNGNGSSPFSVTGHLFLQTRTGFDRNVYFVTNSGSSLATRASRGHVGASGWFLGQHSTTSTAANCHIGTNGLISRSTSSIRYKKDVEDLWDEVAENVVNNLRPVFFRPKRVNKHEDFMADWSQIGLIAEEVHEVEPRLVHYKIHEDGFDEEGNAKTSLLDKPIPDGVQYPMLAVYLLPVVKKQKVQIAELSSEIIELKELTATLLSRLEALETK